MTPPISNIACGMDIADESLDPLALSGRGQGCLVLGSRDIGLGELVRFEEERSQHVPALTFYIHLWFRVPVSLRMIAVAGIAHFIYIEWAKLPS
jgi:hypothetical protein